MNSPSFECKMIHPDAKSPFRKRTTDAGWDLSSIVNIELPPGDFANVPTGICIAPPIGWYFQIAGRSGMWLKGIMVFNGVIDATYTEEIFVGLYNLGKKPYFVEKGDRIAQFLPHEISHPNFILVSDFSPHYKLRGAAGWGSSGR